MLIKRMSIFVLLILIILTVALIFVHSAMSPEVSKQESDAVGGVIEEIIEQVAPNNETFRDFVKKNIRKIAHFAEFGLLGLECAILGFIILCGSKKKRISEFGSDVLSQKMTFCAALGVPKTLKTTAYSFIFGLLVAFADESVQILSSRGPSVTDIWIDLAGFASAYIIFSVATTVVCAVKRARVMK